MLVTSACLQLRSTIRDLRSTYLGQFKQQIISAYSWEEEAAPADLPDEELAKRTSSGASKGPWAGGVFDPAVALQLLANSRARCTSSALSS